MPRSYPPSRDAARVPIIDGFADTVVVVHRLEPEHSDQVIAEATRCSRCRVIIAVLLEDEADESSGHLRTITLDNPHTWGQVSRLPYEVTEHHGGWLVLDEV